MIDRRSVMASTLALLGVAALPVRAFAAKAKVFTGAIKGVAINGYDPVGYFTKSRPVAGSADFTTQWNGVVWRFSSAENLAKFTKNPEKFAPQYGGYCAYAMASGYTASTVPEAWNVVDGKLYLNYSLSVRTRWRKDIKGYIAKADINWPKLMA